jgi:hypothetical protein
MWSQWSGAVRLWCGCARSRCQLPSHQAGGEPLRPPRVVPSRRRSSDLFRTLPPPKMGWNAHSAGAIGSGSECVTLKVRRSAVGAFSCAILGRERRESSGARGAVRRPFHVRNRV